MADNLSLAELEALGNKTDIKPGDGNPPPPDLEAERQRQAAEKEAADKLAAEKLQQQQSQQKTPEELKAETDAVAEKALQRLAELKGKPVEQLTTEEKEELAAAEKAAAPAEEEDEDPAAFWEDVDKLSGDPIVIKWEDIKDDAGNPISPDSPQGALVRQRAVEERAINRFEEALMQNDRRGYQYLLHRQAGKSDEEFFAQKTTVLPDYDKFKESIDLQSEFYRRHLMTTGLPEKQAKLIVDDAVKNKEIFELADKAYKLTETSEVNQVKQLQQQLQQEEQAYNGEVSALNKLIDSTMSSASLKIVIPDAKRPGFAAFVKSLVTYDDSTRKFAIVQAISKENLERQIEALYLQHVNGRVGDIVQRDATTIVTRKLKRAVDKSKEVARTQADPAKGKKTLGEI